MFAARSAALVAAVALVAAPITASAQEAVSAADRTFVAGVSQGGMYEVAAGKLAATRGSTPDVRDLGVMEAHDHGLVGDRLTAIVEKLGLPHTTTLNATFAEKLANLEALHGAAFDRAFVASMDAVHAKDGAAFAAEATGGTNADLRGFATETHRIVVRHIGALHAAP